MAILRGEAQSLTKIDTAKVSDINWECGKKYQVWLTSSPGGAKKMSSLCRWKLRTEHPENSITGSKGDKMILIDLRHQVQQSSIRHHDKWLAISIYIHQPFVNVLIVNELPPNDAAIKSAKLDEC